MQSLVLQKTDALHADFRSLVVELDRELALRDGKDHAFYHQFNQLDKIQHALVAYLEERPVACGALRAAGEGDVEIKRMFVVPEYRGKGIAGVVLDQLEVWAKTLGYRRCILETGIQQPEALRLYQKSGYKLIPNYGPYAGVDTSVCMEKKLLSASSISV